LNIFGTTFIVLFCFLLASKTTCF